MNKEENIEKIKKENGTSGKMYNEKYIKNNYPEIFKDVIEFCSSDKLIDLPFKEKIYHYVNDLKEILYCSNPNCNNIVKFKNSTIGYHKHCSKGCTSKDPNIKQQKEDNSYIKYGTKAPGMNNDIKEKMIKTNQERYGGNSPMQNIEIQEKSKKTLFKNYGVYNLNDSEEIVKRRIESFKKSNYKENYTNTMMSRYGVKYTFQNEDFYKKSKETLFKNYGVFNPYENKEILDRAQKKRKNTIKNNKILNQDNNIIDVDYDTREYLMNCDVGKNHTFKISFELYKSRKQFANYKCTECFPEHFNQTSMSEFELLNFIQKHYKDEIVVNSKKIIYPFELDIYLPEINIAFEFNGIYWHDEQHKSSDYHLKKTELCDENGIKLIHIWEDDWMYKNDIVKSNILNILSIKTNIIDVNDCDIKEITNSEVIKDFLEKNHIQGFIDSQIKIGLYHNNELISLMNFENNIESYELLRFCNKLNTNIIGGYDKLFKYFVINYEPTEIIAYFDRSWSYDKIYENLGFELVHKSQSNYSYVIDGIRKNRFNFGKSILIKEGYSSEKTESEIMLERKIYRIYDSGQLKFIWKDKQI